ncbi:uncharacterized protein VK521_001414 isoform 2-T2 [Ammospiza maritima maritima]
MSRRARHSRGDAMRLWLLCALAVAVAVAGLAGAEHGGSGMAAHRREESQSMPWNSREEEAAQPGRRARSGKGPEGRARRESPEPAQPSGHAGHIPLP